MMYQDIIDDLVLPFTANDVEEFRISNDNFIIVLKDKTEHIAFELMESLRRSEFEGICKMIADKLLNI